MPPVTVDIILNWLREQVEQKKPVDAHTWVDSAQKLNVLQSDEHDKLFFLEQEVAKMKAELIKENSVAAAKVIVEASTENRIMKQQRARVEMIQEMIRIAKLQARLKDNEYRNQ